MKLKDIKFLIITLISGVALGQSLDIEVIDSIENFAISGVQIYVSDKYVTQTDPYGSAKIKLVKNNTSIVFFVHGYNKKTILFDRDLINKVTIQLEHLHENLSEVILHGKMKENYAVTNLRDVEGTHIYAGKKSEVVNLDLIQGNKASNNARQVFSKVVGLNIYDNNDGGLQLNIGGRGLDPNRTANFNTRQNDYDISADVLGYPESYYTPPTEGLEKIEVIRGAASLQYGTQFGGLINFITKRPSTKLLELTLRNTVSSFNTLSNFTSISGTMDKFSYYIYYNGKKGEGFRPNSDYKSNNIFTHLGYQINKSTKVEFEFTNFNYVAHQPGGLSDVQFTENPLQSYLKRNWFAVNWNLYSLKLKHSFSEKTKLNLNLFALKAFRKAIGFRGNPLDLQPKIFDVNGDKPDEFGNYINRDLLVGEFNNFGIESRFLTGYKLGMEPSYFVVGFKLYKANNYARQGAGSKGTDADFSFAKAAQYPRQNSFKFPNFNSSFFCENIFNVSNTLSITPGIRFEHIDTGSDGTYYNYSFNTGSGETIEDNNSFVRNFILMGLGLSFKPIVGFEMYSNFSQNYRSVTFSDIRTINPSFEIDEDITDEKGFNADLGIRGQIKKAFSYDVNVFALLYDNRIGQILGDRAQWIRKNIGTAHIYGFESLLQWNIQQTFFKDQKKLKFEAFSNISVTQSEYIKSEDTNVEGNRVEFIPYLNLKTGVSFGWNNFLSSLQYTFVDAQFTDVTNSPYSLENTTNVIGAIPAYDILDLSISYKFNRYFTLETGVNNLLDNSYFTRRATGYPGPGIIPAAPRSYYATLEIRL